MTIDPSTRCARSGWIPTVRKESIVYTVIMTLLVYLFLFLIGISLGSFLNVMIDRGVKGESIVKKRSHCDFCHKTLSPFDLIPIFNFLLLNGKCRYCNKNLSRQYPLVELATGILFLLTYLLSQNYSISPGVFSPNIITTCYLLTVICYFIVIFVVDLRYELIFENVINSAIFLTILYYIYLLPLTLLAFPIFLKPFLLSLLLALVCGIIVTLFFLFLIWVSRGRGLGEGDVKLGFWLGLLLGFPKIIPALFLAFITGAIAGIILVVLGKKKLQQTVPLAPFLIFGTYLSLFFGNQIISWYLQRIL